MVGERNRSSTNKESHLDYYCLLLLLIVLVHMFLLMVLLLELPKQDSCQLPF